MDNQGTTPCQAVHEAVGCDASQIRVRMSASFGPGRWPATTPH